MYKYKNIFEHEYLKTLHLINEDVDKKYYNIIIGFYPLRATLHSYADAGDNEYYVGNGYIFNKEEFKNKLNKDAELLKKYSAKFINESSDYYDKGADHYYWKLTVPKNELKTVLTHKWLGLDPFGNRNYFDDINSLSDDFEINIADSNEDIFNKLKTNMELYEGDDELLEYFIETDEKGSPDISAIENYYINDYDLELLEKFVNTDPTTDEFFDFLI